MPVLSIKCSVDPIRFTFNLFSVTENSNKETNYIITSLPLVDNTFRWSSYHCVTFDLHGIKISLSAMYPLISKLVIITHFFAVCLVMGLAGVLKAVKDNLPIPCMAKSIWSSGSL